MAAMAIKVSLALLLALAAQLSEGSRILVVMPMPARSHHIAVSGVSKALAERGHDVTYITGLDTGNKINPVMANHRVISIGNPLQLQLKDKLKSLWERPHVNPATQMTDLFDMGAIITNFTLSSPLFRAAVNENGAKFDLVIIEAFFFQEAFVGLGHQFGCPVVAANPFGTTLWINEIMGNPVNPSWVPSPFLGYSDHMSFTERAQNTFMHVASHLMYNYYHLPQQESVLKTYWPDTPAIQDLLRSKIGLTLINNHFTLAYPSPMSPNVVEIGGLHIPETTKPLPKDLQDLMDSAKEGVLFFSMGSNLKVQDMPKEKSKIILEALGSLKTKVLLKWDGPIPKGLSSNIHTIEWAPQADLLAHPNLRAFFTHGGLLSTQESVYHGVPLIGMPMFGDQKFNMLLAVRKGFCVEVDFHTMTRDSLDATLSEVLNNPKYKQNAQRISRIFRSKLVPPKVAAVFAIEHVLEHGADHLRPSSVGMPLHQLLLLDVLAAVLAALALVLAVAYLGCRALCCRSARQEGRDGGSARAKKKTN